MALVDEGFEFAGNVAELFDKPAGEKAKRDLERNMRDIHNKWLAGEIDSDAAIQAIKAQMNSMIGHESGDHYSMMMGLANEFISSIQGARNRDINASFGSLSDPGTYTDPRNQGSPSASLSGSGLPGMFSGVGSKIIDRLNSAMPAQDPTSANERMNLTGSADFQKERGQSLMRNMLMNTESGQAFGEATGLGSLREGPKDPGEQYSKYSGTVTKPDPKPGQQLIQNTQDARKKFGGYNA